MGGALNAAWLAQPDECFCLTFRCPKASRELGKTKSSNFYPTHSVSSSVAVTSFVPAGKSPAVLFDTAWRLAVLSARTSFQACSTCGGLVLTLVVGHIFRSCVSSLWEASAARRAVDAVCAITGRQVRRSRLSHPADAALSRNDAASAVCDCSFGVKHFYPRQVCRARNEAPTHSVKASVGAYSHSVSRALPAAITVPMLG